MGQWVRIGAVSEMPAEGTAKAFEAPGTTICVARVQWTTGGVERCMSAPGCSTV